MANITVHNIKSVNVELNDFETFFTIELNITTPCDYEDAPTQENISLFFDTIESRTAFILTLYHSDQL